MCKDWSACHRDGSPLEPPCGCVRLRREVVRADTGSISHHKTLPQLKTLHPFQALSRALGKPFSSFNMINLIIFGIFDNLWNFTFLVGSLTRLLWSEWLLHLEHWGIISEIYHRHFLNVHFSSLYSGGWKLVSFPNCPYYGRKLSSSVKNSPFNWSIVEAWLRHYSQLFPRSQVGLTHCLQQRGKQSLK